jgi:hypothetical protein
MARLGIKKIQEFDEVIEGLLEDVEYVNDNLQDPNNTMRLRNQAGMSGGYW